MATADAVADQKAAAVDEADAIHTSLILKARISVRPAELITQEHLMTEPSLIHPMTEENL